MSTKQQRQDAHWAVTEMIAGRTGHSVITVATLDRALEHAGRIAYLVTDAGRRRPDGSRTRCITLTYRGRVVLGVEGRVLPADLVRQAPHMWACLLATVLPVHNCYV